ncbi:tyrosine-type recombinase/integrase [Streptomyces sp. NBC_01411]
MVLLGAFASMRPEELAELRCSDIDLDAGVVWVRRAAPELNTGRRVIGDPKSRAGKRKIVLPGFMHLDVRRHLDWFAQPGSDGLVFVGERGAELRGTTFGRKWRKARDLVGLPPNFRFYDLRHTGDTLAADTDAKLKDLIVRAGQSSERAQLIYQHSAQEHQRRLAAKYRHRRTAPASASDPARGADGSGPRPDDRPRATPLVAQVTPMSISGFGMTLRQGSEGGLAAPHSGP